MYVLAYVAYLMAVSGEGAVGAEGAAHQPPSPPSPSPQSDVGPSLLHTAASFGNVQTVVELLGMGVPVNCVMGGKTPLDVARAAGYTTTARAIENRGGRPAEEVEPGAVAAEVRG